MTVWTLPLSLSLLLLLLLQASIMGFDVPGEVASIPPARGFANPQIYIHTSVHLIHGEHSLQYLRRRGGETCIVCVSLPMGHDNRPPTPRTNCVCMRARVCAVVFTSGAVALHYGTAVCFSDLASKQPFCLLLLGAFFMFLTAVRTFSKIACPPFFFLLLTC